MKNLGFFLPLLGLLFLASCGNKANSNAEFWVRGNCDMCKKTIETALAATPGVSEANYDVDAHTLRVSFDSNQVKLPALHQACAKAGYDTKEALAVTSAYDALPKCCKKPEDQ